METKIQYSFKELVRQRTGISMLDSGGESGRHWQQPLPEYSIQLRIYENDVRAVMNTWKWLDANYEIDQELTKELIDWCNENCPDDYWLDASQKFMEQKFPGIKERSQGGDNTYNHENDLNQDFQFTVYSKSDEWYYNKDSLYVIQSHNGADIRGGYSDPVVCRSKGTECGGLFEISIGWTISSGANADGEELSEEEMRELDRTWECGYSSAPSYELNKYIEKVMSYDQESCHVTVLLKTGETVVIYPINWSMMF